LLAQILEVAVEYGHLDRNPASGRRRRLKAPRPRPVHLDTADHFAALLEAASALDGGKAAQTSGRRAAMATLLFAGLRAEEVAALRWRDVDLANGRLYVGRAKTDAGVREIDLLPILRDELAAHKAARAATGPDDIVFVTSGGKPREPRQRPSSACCGADRAEADGSSQSATSPLCRGVVASQVAPLLHFAPRRARQGPRIRHGTARHTDPAFTLRVYTHVMRRDPVERERLRALVEGSPASTHLKNSTAAASEVYPDVRSGGLSRRPRTSGRV
jgi:integrase